MKNKFERQGEFVREYRNSLGLTQTEFGKKVFGKGDPHTIAQRVSNIERGIAGVPLKKFKKFVSVLQCLPETLYSEIEADFRKQFLK